MIANHNEPVTQSTHAYISLFRIRNVIMFSLVMPILTLAVASLVSHVSENFDVAHAYGYESTSPTSYNSSSHFGVSSIEIRKACIPCAVVRTCVAMCSHVSRVAKAAYKAVKSTPRVVSATAKKTINTAKSTYNTAKGIQVSVSGLKKGQTYFQVGMKQKQKGWSKSIGLHPKSLQSWDSYSGDHQS